MVESTFQSTKPEEDGLYNWWCFTLMNAATFIRVSDINALLKRYEPSDSALTELTSITTHFVFTILLEHFGFKSDMLTSSVCFIDVVQTGLAEAMVRRHGISKRKSCKSLKLYCSSKGPRRTNCHVFFTTIRKRFYFTKSGHIRSWFFGGSRRV